jgi:hypothetical protein
VPTASDNVIFNANSAAAHYIVTVTDNATCANLTFTPEPADGVTQFSVGSNFVIAGTFSTSGTQGNRRAWFRSSTIGLMQDMKIATIGTVTDVDFRDIRITGTGGTLTGTRIGDLRGNLGITFSAPKTVYWVTAAGGNWSGNNWAATSGGGASTDNFPLAQDTAVIENTGLNTSATVTLDAAQMPVSGVDMSTRTNAMTFQFSSGSTVYGDWKNGSGTAFAGASTTVFSGRNTQTITSAGKTFPCPILLSSYGGTVELADALDAGFNSLTVTNGTFDTKNYNVTAGSLVSDNSNVRAISLGSSTVTLTAAAINFATSTNLTLSAGTSSIVCNSVTSISFSGGGKTFYDVSFTNTSTATINQSNTFNSLSITAPSAAGLCTVALESDQTITGTLTVAGATAIRRIFLRSSVVGTTRTLTVGTLSATDCDFRDITIAGAAAGSSPTRAGDCGGNTGVTFPAPKTVYWNLAGSQDWNATAWAPGSGGTPDINNFPLAQDTAVFDNAGAITQVSSGVSWNMGTIDMSGRTSAMTFNVNSNSPVVYGNFLFGTGVTPSGTQAIVFSGRGTKTITSNGILFTQQITIDCFTGTVQLADALALDAARTLTLTSGTFDAVTYNVTTGLFSAAANTTLKMGSGTWTLSGTGSLWSNISTAILYKGSANIVLSNTSTSARTFTGGGQSYNKLTIGGATGTSTLTISSNNQFTELASTKTVAHTIALGTTIQTFGAWTVTGTVGNVVTLTGTGTAHILAGACTSGINYLAMGSIGFAATSPGEFYAGANSTGTAAAPVYRTAKPADSTRYWVGGTGNWSNTARWSTGSGGGSGASVPRSHDDVVFNSLSNATAYTATVDTVTGGIRAKSLTIAGPASGNVTLAGSTAIVGIHGNVAFPATGMTRTYTGAITLSGSSAGRTLTTNGVALNSAITVNGVGAGWTLANGTSIGINQLFVTNGSFDTDIYNLTCGSISSAGLNTRSIDFGSSTISSSSSPDFGTTENVRANLTFASGTSQINFSFSSGTINGNNQTFYNVSLTSLFTVSIVINGENTYNNLTVGSTTFSGVNSISLSNNQAINGTLTLSAGANATMRTFLQSNAIGTTRTLTCAAFSATDADFRDITIDGAAAPVSGTRLGDAKGNSGITFGAGVPKYWNLAAGGNWGGAVGWATSSGASPAINNFPLAQDTCLFESTGLNSGATVTLNATYNIGTIDMSARTSNTMTLATGTTTPTIYGNWINGTGTTLTGTGQMTFAGRSSQTITSAGRAFVQQLTVESPSGSVVLQDAFTSSVNSSAALRINAGTFNAATYNVTFSGASATVDLSSSTLARTVAVGSGTWTIPSASTTAWGAGTSTNLTVTGTGTISLTSASAKTFVGGGVSYSGITLNQGGAGTLNVTGDNTFANISNTYSATGATTIAFGTTTQAFGSFTASGGPGRLLTIAGTSATVPATFILNGVTPTSSDYLTITGVRAYDLIDTWYAGANSTNNGSLGWYFESKSAAISVFINESATAADVVALLRIFLADVSESATATDVVASLSVFISRISDAATAADVVASLSAFLANVSDAATAADVVVSLRALLAGVSESATAADVVDLLRVFLAEVSESAIATDVVVSLRALLAGVSESATAADVVASLRALLAGVSESATAADVTGSLRTLLANVSDSATAADIAASLRALLAEVSESAIAADIAASLRVFLTNVSESATSSDLLSAALTLSASISELTTGSDAVAVESRVSFPTVAELIAAADVLSGGLLLSTNIAEASTGADSTTGANTASMNIEESSAAADAGANSNTTTPTISETATPSDAPTGVNTGTSSVAEAAQMTDSFSNNLLFLSSITEATTAQEIATAILIFNRAVSEATTASEVLVAVAAFNAVVPESVTGTDVANALVSVGGSISEALTALDVAVAANIKFTAIFEAATAQEAASNVYTANPVIAETASPLDAAQSANTGSSSLSESATVSEDQVAQISAFSAVVELITAQETAAANLLLVTGVAEAATLADSTSVAPSTFGVVALAAAQAAESFNLAGSVYNAILPTEAASALVTLRRSKVLAVNLADYLETGAGVTADTLQVELLNNNRTTALVSYNEIFAEVLSVPTSVKRS